MWSSLTSTLSSFELGTRSKYLPDEISGLRFDVLFSAYNLSERVRTVFERVSANEKVWIVHPEYGFSGGDLPQVGSRIDVPAGSSETDFWRQIAGHRLMLGDLRDLRVAIDITGMLRPQIMLLPKMLAHLGLAEVTVLYSDPHAYTAGASTQFLEAPVDRIAPIGGLEGTHIPGAYSRELLVIGAGYDAELVRRVAEEKNYAIHRVLLGLPGLQAHMYQEARLNLADVAESISNLSRDTFMYAPASDPFVTAMEIESCVRDLERTEPVDLYLSPLGPKPQVLGFAWYMFRNPSRLAQSALFPYVARYSANTSSGLSAVHVYELEL